MNADLKECSKLARKICRRKHANKRFVGTKYDHHNNPCAEFVGLIRGNTWLTTLSDLRKL